MLFQDPSQHKPSQQKSTSPLPHVTCLMSCSGHTEIKALWPSSGIRNICFNCLLTSVSQQTAVIYLVIQLVLKVTFLLKLFIARKSKYRILTHTVLTSTLFIKLQHGNYSIFFLLSFMQTYLKSTNIIWIHERQ